MEKRYYWLKLQAGFFGSLRIKKLRRMKRGDTLLCIYLKMQLASLAKDGVLEYKGIEEDMAAELAFDLNEKVADVRAVLAFLTENELLERIDETHYLLPWVVENTGSETAATQRWRDWKKKQDVGDLLDSNTTPTNHQRTANAEKRREDKEIDIDKSRTRKAGGNNKKWDEHNRKWHPKSDNNDVPSMEWQKLLVDLNETLDLNKEGT